MLHIKPDKIRKQKSVSTLDETHKKYIEMFRKSRSSVEVKKKRLRDLTEKMMKMSDDSTTKSTVKMEIEALGHEINDITNYTSELNYYDKIDDILCEYYDIVNNNKDSQIHCEQSDVMTNTKLPHKRSKMQQHSHNNIMTFFNKKNSNNPSNDDTIKKTTETNDVMNQHKKMPKSRAFLHDKYLKVINGYSSIFEHDNEIKFCFKCNTERILVQTEGVYVCPSCGEVETALIESDIPNYKDSDTEKTSYPYKRLNHFIEWLNQFQGKESTDIPKETYDAILLEISRQGIKNVQKITMTDMRIILRKLNMNKYYEHSASIISKITGKPPPSISRETEEELKQMFREIQEPFIKFCPRERTNFLSYSYVLHKFFQILEMREFVSRLPLLKSREKLRSQDKIWKKICDELGWEFYPSI